MTEVDAAMPEGVGTLSIPNEAANSSNDLKTKTALECSKSDNDKQKQMGKETCLVIKESLKEPSHEPISVLPMEVDGVDTEEDESQNTSSSTENGVANAVGGDDSKMSEHSSVTSGDNSKDSKEDKEEDATAVVQNSGTADAALNENSSNACDGVAESPYSKQISTKSQDGLSNGGNSVKNTSDTKDCDEDDDGENSVGSSKENKPDDDDGDGDADVNDVNTNDGPSNPEESSNSKTQDTALSKEEHTHKHTETVDEKDEPMDTTEASIDAAALQKIASPENNDVHSKKEVQSADRENSSVVDLGDDSDEESFLPEKESNDNTSCIDPLNKSDESTNNVKQANSVSTDSDGAVVIGSDSENEMIVPTMASITPVNLKKGEEVIDDDDDDCVVIEDDTPAPNDLTKRKSIAMDANNSSDDSQPPTKRQRNAGPSVNVNQITIKDARSLMPQDATSKKPAPDVVGGVYPVNITPATAQGMTAGPPKLVPMSNASGMAMPGLQPFNANANLLPGLTDDMFVLEAPSFIVPYIYEKPPADNLKLIVKEIENKYKLTKEDLVEADKSDEFDMMTEQNKQEDKTSKKKKRRGGGDGDESWSEESEEEDDDDDDDDSESEMRTKVLIKEASDDLNVLKVAIKPAAALVAQPQTAGTNAADCKPGQENYFESPLGKFFMDIGVGLVQEFVQSDLIRLQKRKMRKSLGKNITEFERAIAALSGNLEASKKKNDPFKFTMKRCEFCNFKSESALSMANHYETPHMNGPLYKCNFCTFEIRNATEIVYHMEAVHNIKARLIKPLPYHQCPNCGFEDNGRAKLARHQPVCAKKFRPETNLSPPVDWEAPAKIPRIKPRHGLVGTATAYQAMAAQAAAQKAALASIQQQQQQAAQARSIQAAAIAAQNAANKIRGRAPVMPTKSSPNNAMLRGPNQVRSPMPTNVVLPNNYQIASGQLIQQAANAMAKKTLTGQPSISITPLPRQSAAPQAVTSPSTSKLPPAGMKPGQSPSGGNKAQFVICEICDGYIRDLEQLRNHMQWMHKVKIHPKMIYNRPPLNCQKCQFRFFTDQGLERHLLGSHGLVTSSMQEAANKGKDAGRCPVCGRMYQWKLLNHVSRDHHMTLKPAHLSYKCTVCTATFGMYKQFETHVYTAHSTVAKKAMDGKKNNNAASGMGGVSGSSINQRSSMGSANDSLLKPLKINDEITIIPQPASKPRIMNMESHVID